jgi:hypothetical protein
MQLLQRNDFRPRKCDSSAVNAQIRRFVSSAGLECCRFGMTAVSALRCKWMCLCVFFEEGRPFERGKMGCSTVLHVC